MLQSKDINDELIRLQGEKANLLKQLEALNRPRMDVLENEVLAKERQMLKLSINQQLGTVNAQIKEFSIAYKNCFDQILIDVCKRRLGAQFDVFVKEAHDIYQSQNKVG